MRIEGYLPAVADELRRVALCSAPREACGLITAEGTILELENRAKNPEQDFNIGPLRDIARGTIAVWHTHPDQSPPSDQDRVCCQASGLPWIVAGPKNLWVLHREAPRYLAREFVYGIEDCWQLVVDWFAGDRGVILPWFKRPPDGWWKTEGPSPYLEHAKAYRFSVTAGADADLKGLQPGDILLMQVAGRRPNHAAIYTGGGEILHHLYGRLSTVEQLSATYQRMITHHCRYSPCN